MANMARWIAWAEHQIGRVVVAEQLHVAAMGVTQGPLTVTFRTRLLQPSPAALRKMLGLGPALALAVRVEAVRITDTARGILIELPSPRPRTPTAAMLAQQTSGLRFAVGMDQWRRPATISLPQHPTGLFVGPSRKGKTQAMKASLYALATANPFRRLQYVIFSQKQQDWAAFQDRAACWGVVSDPEETARALAWAAGTLLQGRARDGAREPAIVFVLDDLLNLLKRVPQIAGPVGELASMGGGCGLYLFVGTQDAGSRRGTGGADVEANITVRVVYRAASAMTAARAAGAGGLGIEMLSGHAGDAVLLVDGEAVRIATAQADDRMIAQLPTGPAGAVPWLATRADTVDMPYPASGGYTRLYPDDLPPQNGHGGHRTDNGRGQGAGIHFPIGEARPLTPAEQGEVRRLAELAEFQYRGALSLNRLTVHVYGSKNPQCADWIRAALAGTPEETPAADSFEVWDLNTAEGRAALSALLSAGGVTWRPAEHRFPKESGQ